MKLVRDPPPLSHPRLLVTEVHGSRSGVGWSLSTGPPLRISDKFRAQPWDLLFSGHSNPLCKMRDNQSVSQPPDDTPNSPVLLVTISLIFKLKWRKLPLKHREESSTQAPTLNSYGDTQEYPFLWMNFCSDFPEPLIFNSTHILPPPV